MRDPYRPFQALVAPARPTAQLSRLVLGCILMVVIFISLIFAAMALLGVLLPSGTWSMIDADLEVGRTPGAVLAELYAFVLYIIALAITARAVHARSLPSFIGNWSTARFHFGRVCLYLVGLQVAMAVLIPANPDLVPTLNMAFSSWLALLPLAIPALLVQTGAEEILFRGYMQSQLAARFANPRVWILVPSIAFGLLHYDPAVNGSNAWFVVLWATAFGVAAADLTARTGTLGAALALHFVNNFFAIILVAPEGYFDGLALYTFPFQLDELDQIWLWAPVNMMVLFVSWLTARIALRV